MDVNRSSVTTFSEQSFHSLIDRGAAATIEDVVFDRCTFDNCAISLTRDLSKRAFVRNVRLQHCLSINCDIGPVIFEDVCIEGLTTNDLLIMWGPLFKHVVMKGNMGEIKINTVVHHVDRTPETQSPFDSARSAFYSEVDWALDIREAKFREFDLSGVPARLVRRDPNTQVVVTRARALQQGWKEKISASNKYWPSVIEMFLQDEEPDVVLVVPTLRRKKKVAELLDQLSELRYAGVVEPD